jgi:hypothetical protein
MMNCWNGKQPRQYIIFFFLDRYSTIYIYIDLTSLGEELHFQKMLLNSKVYAILIK